MIGDKRALKYLKHLCCSCTCLELETRDDRGPSSESLSFFIIFESKSV